MATPTSGNPYDELPYRSRPIEWSAPERLAAVSLVHGGPAARPHGYRVLELGCADGANLLPLAYYRRNAHFVGVDGAASQVEIAEAGRSALGLRNVEFVHADFVDAERSLSGQFDYIIAHGVLSWVTDAARDALLTLCARRLSPGGLLYLNYNTYPGWHVRGMVRRFLLAHTARAGDLRTRATMAQDAAARLAASFATDAHPYAQLMARELRFVCESDMSYVAHEFLAAENHAYWRSEFLALVADHGLAYVADADFNYALGRVADDLPPRVAEAGLAAPSLEDAVDLLCYRQLHSPILTPGPWTPRPLRVADVADLTVAAPLVACGTSADGHVLFRHPSGFEVEAKSAPMLAALDTLGPRWPHGVRVAEVFPDVAEAMDDLLLLHRNGLLELRYGAPGDVAVDAGPLHALEAGAGYVTSPHHTLALPPPDTRLGSHPTVRVGASARRR